MRDNGFQLLTVFAKNSVLENGKDPGFPSKQ